MKNPTSFDAHNHRNSPSNIIRICEWEIFAPPPHNSFKGVVIPRAFIKGKRRKLCLEVRNVHPPGNSDETENTEGSQQEGDTYEECNIRVLDPATRETRRAVKRRWRDRIKGKVAAFGGIDIDETEAFGRNNGVEVMLAGDDDDESESITEVPAEFLDTDYSNVGGLAGDDESWRAKYRFPIKAFKLRSSNKNCVTVEIFGTRTPIHQIRDLIFDSSDEAADFCEIFKRELSKEGDRAQKRLQVNLKGTQIQENEKITFLVEMVSAWDIPAGDITSSDPYVKCSIGGEPVHQTKYISKTLDPIWTLKTHSLFTMTVEVKALFLSEGLRCLVMDFDKVGNDEMLGCVIIPPGTLYHANGERMEFKLAPPPRCMDDEVPGFLAVRCRRASAYDMKFLNEYYESENAEGSDQVGLGLKNIAKQATESAGGGGLKTLITKVHKVVRDKDHPEGIKQYKLRPGPDPKRVHETTWMTKKQIGEECLKDSHKWVDSGSGRLGTLYLEVLGCDDLPNMDTGGFAGNKTDAFVAIVFEDTFVTTDIIDDCLNPRWMPWSKRAFVFHLMHSSSEVFLGVFDYDCSLNPADDHDVIGRASIDLSNLQKDTVYTMKFNIYTTARMSTRKRKGTISVRLRLEINDERQLLLSSLEPPPLIYVNCKNKKDFRIVRVTCTGKYNMDNYNMKIINSYIEELLSFQHSLFYIQDALLSLILWRGTLPINIISITIMLPVHSFIAFIAGVLVVERPQLFPSFFLFGTAWLLLASMEYRRQCPDVWSRCKSYSEIGKALILGESKTPPETIDAYENYDEAQHFLEIWKKRIADAEEQATNAYEESVKIQEEHAKEMEELGNQQTDISTKRTSISIDPFKPILYPVQQNLAMVCRYTRHLKYVVMWEECYISFWVVTGCILMGIIFLFVPWFPLILWTSRALVWTIFGPWMKLVDIFYVSKIQPLTAEELQQQKVKKRERRRLLTSAAANEARIKREDAVKLKAMKKFMFGRYITRIPVLKEDRYPDLPLPESTAVPYNPEPVPLSELAMQDAGYHRTRLPGQHLVGSMIPRSEFPGFRVRVGQATARPELINGGGIEFGPDSNMDAYTKIGSLVVTAAVVTWLGVPMLSSITEMFLKWISQN